MRVLSIMGERRRQRQTVIIIIITIRRRRRRILWWWDTGGVGWTCCNHLIVEWKPSKRTPSSLSIPPANSISTLLNSTFRSPIYVSSLSLSFWNTILLLFRRSGRWVAVVPACLPPRTLSVNLVWGDVPIYQYGILAKEREWKTRVWSNYYISDVSATQ